MNRLIAYIPADAYVEGHGFRVSIVTDWPYTGGVGQKMPWFWGPTYEDAIRAAKEHNARLGVDEMEAAKIILGSMRTDSSRHPRRRRRRGT